ncbi:Trichodiene oxygenase [Penicillium rolfsii]|nr:Trichodiene oxygenase [Penicillium rolfsii]
MYDCILVPVLGMICWVLGLLTVIYRLYVHPLAGFPGPKFAAATFLYEFYYDVVKGGMYIWEIERMHEKYGPIVRINPRELHIKDPSYYDIIHAGSSRKRAKDPKYAVAFGAPNSLVGTINHDHHRLRRSYLSNYFSKRSITRLTPSIHQKVDKLIHRFENAYHQSTVLNLHLEFGALAADVITHYCYGWSYGYLDDPSSARSNDLVDGVAGLMTMFHINRFFPFLITVFLAMPRLIMRWIQPQMASLFEFKARLRQQAANTLMEKKNQHPDSHADETIFDALVSSRVPPHEKTLNRLEDESALLLGAGTETTARAIAMSMFHLIDNREMGLKLREELKTVLKTPQSKASWTDLEKLPYLTGAVNEGLRLSHGMTSRLARISPTEPMVYKDWLIPPGTPVSQSNYFVHMDKNLFPEPEKFDPGKWVRVPEGGEHLSRFIVAFTKGSRQCLGINLAYSEIYMTLAHIVRRFDFAPFETTVDDLAVYREQGVGLPKSGYFGVKAMVINIVED